MGDRVNVLVVEPNSRTKAAISQLPQDVSRNYEFIFHCLKPGVENGPPSLQDYLEDAKKTVQEEDIQLVINNGDVGALLKAALTQEFAHLRGPSVESVFLGYNKYYTRCHLDPTPIPFAIVDLSVNDLDQECEMALQKVGTPAFVKPTSLSASRGVSSITSLQQLKSFIQSYVKSDVFAIEDVDASFMNPFYTKYVDKQKYPLATKPTSILEHYMEDATAQVNADGYVLNGKIFHWSICDNLFSKSSKYSQYYFGTMNPTSLPEITQQNIWNFFDVIVEKMIKFGFNNEFVNVEIFVQKSGELKLLEINPRRGGNTLTSGEVFINGDITVAQLRLAQGQNPGTPIRNGRHVMYSYIRTCGSGKAEEFFDYNCTILGLIPENPPGHHVDGSGQAGDILCRTVISGDSQEEVLEKYRSICRQVLLQPELSLWI